VPGNENRISKRPKYWEPNRWWLLTKISLLRGPAGPYELTSIYATRDSSNCQPSAVERFRSQQHSSGTGFLTMSRRPIRCRLCSSNWNAPCSSSQ